MKKIIVIGCPGSGKSTFSRKLHNISGLPLFHLDMLNWKADRTTVEKDVFLKSLSEIIGKDEWIIDGNYADSIELRLKACDTVFFLDYPVETCLEGISERKGKSRPDMPWIESDSYEDPEFIDFIKNFPYQTRPDIINLLKEHPDKDIYVFKDRSMANDFLMKIK